MGSSCSATKSTSVVQPLQKVKSQSANPTPKAQKITSCNDSRRPSQTEYAATNYDSKGFSSDYFHSPLGITIKHRLASPEIPNEDGGTRRGTLNDTNINASRTTEASAAKRVFQYKKGPLIGKGTYGEVYECLNLNTGELLAVKTFKIHGDLNKLWGYIEAMKKEVSLLRNLGHANIVKYFSAEAMEVNESANQATVDIVLEYVSGGSVRKLLDKFNKLEEKVVGTYTRQVLEGLTYLHMNGIVHRNIKGSNILIDTTGIIKLTDFGCSGRPDRFSEENIQDGNKAGGFPRGIAFWSAPEVVMRKAQGKPADVWGVGCVVLEMLTGLPPWSDTTRSMDEFVRQISLGTPPPFPKEISENCRDFLYKTFKFKPEDRPSPYDLLDHPFVRDDQETSYMEAESMQTAQTFQTFTPGKVLDLMSSGEKKYMDLKTNAFLKKEATGNLSVSNINLGRLPTHTTNEFPSSNNLLGRLDSKETNQMSRGSSLENRHSNRHGKGKLTNDRIGVVVLEANHSEEFSPGADLTRNFQYNFESMNANQLTEEAAKEARRKQLEEEMNRDLMRINTQQLEYDMIEERSDREENADDTYEEQPNYMKGKRSYPMKNSLFVGQSRFRSQEGDESQVRDKIEVKPINNFMQKIPGPEYLDIVEVNSYRSNRGETPNKNAVLEQSGEKIKQRNNTTPRKKQNEDRGIVDPNNEEEVQKQKERLRKQFEEQMELSLARVNSEKLIQVLDKDSEPGDTVEPRGEGLRRNFEEESSNPFGGVSVDGFRDTWKMEDQTIDMEKITKKKFEDILGGLKVEEGDDSLRTSSPQITESDGRSPDNRTKKKTDFVAKFSAEGVINEAEEIKEDSFEGEVSYGKPSSKQHI